MKNWFRRAFSWRKNPSDVTQRPLKRPVKPTIDSLEDRLAPAITAINPLQAMPFNPRHPDAAPPPVVVAPPTPPALAIAITSPASNSLVNENIQIRGQVRFGVGAVQVAVRTDNGSFQSVPVSGRNFSIPTSFATNGTADGRHTFVIRAVDSAGRTAQQTFVVRLDTVAPVVNTFDIDAASDTAPVGDGITTQTIITLKGTTEAGSSVRLVTTGQTVTADANGNFAFANVALPTGSTNFQVRATDAAGNQGAIVSKTITRGTTSTQTPTVTINPLTTGSQSPTLTGTVSDSTATVQVTVNNTTVTATVSGANWSAVFAGPIPSGTYSVTATATTTANNVGSATLAAGLIIDAGAPTLAITSTQTSPTKTTPIPVTFTFNEDVFGFTAADVTVTNGTLSNFVAVDAKTYTASITPTANGAVTVNVAAGVATDSLNNGNAAATFSITFDTTAPTVAIASTVTSPTNSTSIPLTFTFNEDVTGFAASDIAVTNGTISNFAVVDAKTYTATLTPTANTTATVNVAAGAAQDAAGNTSAAATAFTIVSDTVAPTVAITSTLTSPTTATSIPVTFTFSEAVTGFTLADISVTNGVASNFVAVSGTVYTASIAPVTDGVVSVNVAAAVATDASGNDNTAGTFSITADLTGQAPVVTVNALDSNDSTPTLTGTVSDSSATVSVTVNGQTFNAVVNGNSWSATVPNALANGNYTVSVSATNGNGTNTATAALSIDATAPTLEITTARTSPTNANPIPITFRWSENIVGFSRSDVTVVNGTLDVFAALDGKIIVATIIPSGSGTVTVTVDAGKAFDEAGNPNVAGTFSIVYDGDAPTPVITSSLTSPTNATSIPITVTFNEDVTGFAASDIVVTNGTLSGFTAVDAKTYTANVAPTADGAVTVAIAAAAASDLAGNTSLAAANFSITSDRTAPTVAVTSTATNPTTSATFPITITFSEAMTGFTLADIAVTNGTAGNFVAVSGSIYTAVVTPTADGLVTVNVNAGVAQDAAGNNNLAGSFSITADVSPDVAITSTLTSPTNQTTIPVTVTFGEDVTGFEASDVVVTNGTLSGFTAVDAKTYTFNVAPTAQGQVTIDIAAGVAVDGTNNPNTAATFSIVFDTTAPTPTITSNVVGGITNAASFTVTVSFDEDVTGFTVADLSATNGTLSGFTAVDAKTYTVVVTPTADGTVTVDLAAGVEDLAGNAAAAASISVTSDRTAPTTQITTTEPNPTDAASFLVTISFSENVTGLTLGDIDVVNGTATDLITVDGMTYTAIITPTADGLVTVSLAAGAAQDAATNGSAAASLNITSDRTAPTTTITSSASGSTNLASIPVTITFNEVVTGFDATDVVVANGTLSGFTAVSGTVYTFNVAPTADGQVTVSVGAGIAQDAAGNVNEAATPFSVISDQTAPTPTITSTESGTTTLSAIPVTVTFDESVTGFNQTDVVVTNGTISDFTAVSGTVYTFNVTPTAQGQVTVDIAADVAQDPAGNGNVAATTFSIIANLPPSATITSTLTSPTNQTTVPVTVTFSEDVTGFEEADVVVTNGTLSSFTAVDAKTYTFNVTPTADGAVNVDIAAGVAVDGTNAGNTAATFSIAFDSTAPIPTITSDVVGGISNAASFTVTVSFDEDVTGFTVADLTATNGTLSGFTAVDAKTYTVVVTPTADGTVTVDLAAGVEDLAGNAAAAATISVTSDTTAPTTQITTTETSPTSAASFLVTIAFSEDVAGLTLGDIDVVNGVASDLTTVNGMTYTAIITPTADGVVTISLAAGAAQDAATNDSAAASLNITSDRTAPTPVVSSTLNSPTNASSIPITVTFDEDVTDFTMDDVVVINGTLGDFTVVDAKTYTATVTPIADGVVTVAIAAGVANDAAGNGNAAAAIFDITSDRTLPTVAITSTESSPTTAATIPITIAFSELVTGFSAVDVVVVNGTISDFTAVNGSTYTAVITPTADGLVTIDVNADVAQDAAGNGNVAATTFSIIADLPPTATITSTLTGPTNQTTVPVTVTFSEDVTGFEESDVVVTNGAISGFTAVDAKTYTFNVNLTADGTVTVDVAAGVAVDGTNNPNAAATFSIVFDSSAPTPTITSDVVGGVTNAASFTVTISFDEDVTGFTIADLSATNGTLSDFTVVDAQTYTVVVTPTADGTVAVDLAAGVEDFAGNAAAAATISVTSDTTAPTTQITTTETSPTNAASFLVTIAFSEDVTGLTLGDIDVVNGVASDLTTIDGMTYTAIITPTADGVVTISLAAGAAQDAATNDSAAASLNITSDRTAPTVAITSTVSGSTNLASIPVTITFSEDVAGFDETDVVVANGTLSGFTAVSGTVYTFNVAPTADGQVTVSVGAGIAQDAAGNVNEAATPLSVISDQTAPTPTITSTESGTTTLPAIPVTVTFNENVTGFNQTDVVVTNGTISDFTAVSGTVYTFNVTPAAQGQVSVAIAADVAQDAAGNGNVAATTFSIIADLPPTATITSTVTSPTNDTTVPVTVTFSEDVTGFEEADVVVTNGTLSGFTAIDAKTYTFNVTPTADGAVTVAIAAAAAVDSTNNATSAVQFQIDYDGTAPTLRRAQGDFAATVGTSGQGLIAGMFDDNSIENSSVTFKILMGSTPLDLNVTLFDRGAPLTVANFFNYLDRYDDNGGVLFHRTHIEPALKVIQGGGYNFNDATNSINPNHIVTDSPILNEYGADRPNERGTIAMAKTSNPNSATSEFFFNLDDVNITTLAPPNAGGFTVFGEATSAADLAVLDQIAAVPIKNLGGVFSELPLVDGTTLDENNVVRVQQVVVNNRDDALTYTVTSSNTSAVGVSTSGFQGNQLSLQYLAAGQSTITVTATDKAGNSASTTFVITVT